MESFNSGYIALAIVGLIFLGLQFWWISMVIKNGTERKVLTNIDQTEQIKKRLERTFQK